MTDPASPPRRDVLLLRTARIFFCIYAFFYLLAMSGVMLFSLTGYNTLFSIALWTTAGALLIHLFRGGSQARGFGGWVLFLFLVGMFTSAGLMVRLMVLYSLRK